jgi:hypothetical protein
VQVLASSIVFRQPSMGWHESSVHALPSSQLSGVTPGMQVPLLQKSPTVHGSPSSQVPELGTW